MQPDIEFLYFQYDHLWCLTKTGLLIQKPQKNPKKLKKIKPPKKSPKQTKTTYQNPKNTPWNVCLYELSSCSTQSNNGLCLFLMNDALFLSLNQWHWCFSAFDRAVIDIFSWWWWWFVEFLILEANTITFTTCSSSFFFSLRSQNG